MWLQFLLVRSALLALVNLTEADFEIGIWRSDGRAERKGINTIQPSKDELFPQEGSLPGDPYFGVPGAST